jgi:hypothetical protein
VLLLPPLPQPKPPTVGEIGAMGCQYIGSIVNGIIDGVLVPYALVSVTNIVLIPCGNVNVGTKANAPNASTIPVPRTNPDAFVIVNCDHDCPVPEIIDVPVIVLHDNGVRIVGFDGANHHVIPVPPLGAAIPKVTYVIGLEPNIFVNKREYV